MLIEYSRNGLPKIPDLLTLGRPHYGPSAFHLERHWTDIVDGHESLSKRQRDQQEAIWELLSTEVEYIRKLRAVIDVSFRLRITFQLFHILH
jgi:pleckstrin homology domain-containing family G member 5